MKDQFHHIIEKFKSYKVLVIGDAMLDMYIKGTTDRICREAPVPVINVREQEHNCGGAANTAINVAALGAKTYFLSVIGKDENGRELLEVLKKKKVNTDHIIKDQERTTIAKKRITAASIILLRIDEGNTNAINEKIQTELNRKVKKLHGMVDAIILSDYGYGIITDSLIHTLEQLNNKRKKILIVDSKELYRFKKLYPTAVKPNYEETIKPLNLPKLQNSERVQQVFDNGNKLFEITGAKYINATLDRDGCIVFEKGKEPYRILSAPRDNKKSIGAGDTFISALTLALCSGVPAEKSAEIAAAAAAVVLQKDGTVVCTRGELKAYFNTNPKHILKPDDLVNKIQELRNEGKTIVFTNGCFDILHRGHINLLNQSKALGDVLIVGINSDESIRKLKGSERPINSLDDRITVLSGLQHVDYRVSVEENSPVNIIKLLKPDIFVKGGDYTIETIPEAALVNQLGGQVKIIPFSIGRSTTQLIKKLSGSLATRIFSSK